MRTKIFGYHGEHVRMDRQEFVGRHHKAYMSYIYAYKTETQQDTHCGTLYPACTWYSSTTCTIVQFGFGRPALQSGRSASTQYLYLYSYWYHVVQLYSTILAFVLDSFGWLPVVSSLEMYNKLLQQSPIQSKEKQLHRTCMAQLLV